MEDCKKSCGRCSHYGALVNQGYWWCNAGHTENMDAENCEDYNDSLDGVVATSSSSITSTYYDIPKGYGDMAKYKVMRAKKRRKKERGIKHGRR